MKRFRLLLLILGGLVAVAGPDARAQEVPPPPAEQHPDEGKTIVRIVFKGAADPEPLRLLLKTRAGRPLRLAEIRDDEQKLWKIRKVLVREVTAQDTEDGGVIITFDVIEPHTYDRLLFRGLDHFTEDQARSTVGVARGRRISDIEAPELASDLEQRYRRDGYHHARVRLEADEQANTMTMVVDEGPEVTVRRVRFRGNRAFPGDAPLDLYQNLVGSGDLESQPAGWFLGGKPYSEEAVEADLDKLRIFYRRMGYRDARVELAERTFSQDQAEVDLTFRVIEGRRYRIRAVRVKHHLPGGELNPSPLYSEQQILDELIVKAGEFYNRDRVNRDKRAVVRFYGERGHPMSGAYGRETLDDALEWVDYDWLQPVETFDTDAAEITLTFEIIEGTPKTLRDVRVEANTQTQDRIVRRKVLVFPGETLDVTKIDRSLQVLDSLRYFQDPASLQGVRFELAKTGDPDQVDLVIQVQEGDTGSFLWGAGVSTGFGVQGRFQFSKRNFDLFRLPSSASPGTVIREIVNSEAFHGGGQEFDVSLAPGTEISAYRVTIEEPDLFGQHMDTIGASVSAYRQLRILDSYDSNSLGAIVGLQRNFSDDLQVGFQLRQETVRVRDVDANAPTIVYDAEGSTEMRSFRVQSRFRHLDNLMRPAEGYDFMLYGEVAGGLLGAEEDFVKLGGHARYYHLLTRDSLDRPHVLSISQQLDFGKAYGDTNDLFLTERWYMGGSNLRGFDQRDAGPVQFDQPLGGEARYLSRIEYRFPMVSSRWPRAVKEVELLRGVVFTDWGLLGTEITDPSFRELRLSAGVGLRILVPYLGLPIALDFGVPLMYEDTDNRRIFYFSLAR